MPAREDASALHSASPSDPIQRALAYGIDISLLRSNLQRTVAERLNALDANAAFIRGIRRPPRR
ncbi:MAG TPA: hypothetical protein VGR37_15640 [Longimicrobiaceae bacterium]|nr:hypothetical protein [Longimicrobiaceae bacterium]